VTPAVEAPAIRLASARGLLGASFDLLGQATEEMRRASFYVGLVVLGTVAPLALASWAIEVKTVHLTVSETARLADSAATGWSGWLWFPAFAGIIVAIIESRVLAAAILGARMLGRPLTSDQALARSRMVFWRAFWATVLAGITLLISQFVIAAVIEAVAPIGAEATILATVLGSVLVGAPLAYVLSGVVLGDVGPIESISRSFRVYRARKWSAIVVAVFESAAALLILFGLSAGLDLAIRVFDGLGLGADAGPAGILLVALGIAVVTFASGTLLLTVMAISIAPQIVMFVGLTHATMGLDHVRPGADHDPAIVRPGRRRFRMITRPLWLGAIVAWLSLGLVLVLLAGS
jgi:hypothetical protein